MDHHAQGRVLGYISNDLDSRIELETQVFQEERSYAYMRNSEDYVRTKD